MPTVPVYIKGENYQAYLEAKKTGWSDFVNTCLQDFKGPSRAEFIEKTGGVSDLIKGNSNITTADKIAEPSYEPVE